MRIRATLTIALLTASTAAALWAPARSAARLLSRSWTSRVAIAGRSMEPALEDGDWVLVDPEAYAARSPRPGELILVPDPRAPERVLIKRVATTSRDGQLTILGDAPDASTDSRDFGPIAAEAVQGRPWLRYWPLRRLGPLR